MHVFVFEAGQRDRRFVLDPRPVACGTLVDDDLDVDFALLGAPERVEDRHVLEFEHRHPQGPAFSFGLGDEGEQRLLEPAREPSVGGPVGHLVWV
jgi:hypothetical protein